MDVFDDQLDEIDKGFSKDIHDEELQELNNDVDAEQQAEDLKGEQRPDDFIIE